MKTYWWWQSWGGWRNWWHWHAPTHATPLAQLRAAQRQAHGEDE